jgi:RNA polymerase sigma-70 factor (ECF subfamily)
MRSKPPPGPGAETETCRVEEHLDRLYAYALHLAGAPDDARDLVQASALKALGAKNVPDDALAYRTWLFRILRNTWIDECRRRARQPTSWDALEQDGTASGNDAWHPDVSSIEKRLFNRLAVREGLARIAPDHREVLVLVDMAGFTYKEVAELLEVPIGTVMSRVSRARKRLLQALEEPAVRPLRLRLVRRG